MVVTESGPAISRSSHAKDPGQDLAKNSVILKPLIVQILRNDCQLFTDAVYLRG